MKIISMTEIRDISQDITATLQAIEGTASNWVKDDNLYQVIDQLCLAVKHARRMDESATLTEVSRARRSLAAYLASEAIK